MDDSRENNSTNNVQNEVKKGEELPAEPSEPSVIYVDKQKGIPTRFLLTLLMKSLLDCSILSSNQNVMVTGDNR